MAAQIPVNEMTSCGVHPDEVAALFCVSCDKGICMTCITDNSHGQHHLCKPHEIAEVRLKQFQQIMEKEDYNGLQQKIKQLLGLLERQKQSVTENQDKTSAKIAKRYQELAQLIKKEKQNLVMHSKRLHDQEIKHLSDLESAASRCTSYLEKYKRDPEAFCHTHKQDMELILKDLKQVQDPTAPADIKDIVSFEVIEEVTEEVVNKMFGVIKERSNLEPITHVRVPVKTLEPVYEHMELVNVFTPEVQLPSSGIIRLNISKIAPVDMQTAFVLLGNFNRLYKVQLSAQSTAEELLSNIYDISQVRKGFIYLCSGRQLQIYGIKEGKTYTLDDVSPNTVQSIALTKEGNLMVCIKSQNQHSYESILNTLDPAGILMGKSITTTRDPGYMYRIEEHCGNACYLGKSYDSGAIQQDNGGSSLDRYNGKIGCNPAKTFDPRGMCVDEKDQIIIADCKKNALHLLNKDWSYNKFLLREWDGLNKPTAVTLFNKFLWIAQEDGSIQLRKYAP
ncbi:uncharacterized protein [Argopecten irradians]|uniref:uncharacterized protein n=1 Tax=Argopecten irradians TaxID=31199 RepID=UPI003714879F